MKIKFELTGGGSMGCHYLIEVDGRYIGHFYPDADNGFDMDKFIEHVEKSSTQEKTS